MTNPPASAFERHAVRSATRRDECGTRLRPEAQATKTTPPRQPQWISRGVRSTSEAEAGTGSFAGLPRVDAVAETSWDGQVPLLGQEFRRFMLEHKFGMEEIVTKLEILQEEYQNLHAYNPIEGVSSRLKTPESLIEKVRRKGHPVGSLDDIRRVVTDVGGVRVRCSFVSDVYRVFDVLADQVDLTVREVRDYIAEPKANGYRSLHALFEVPVFMSGGAVPVVVELQFRTIAMDFWASLEHKIFYKYRDDVPQDLTDGLTEAAETASALDSTMERLHEEVRGIDDLPAAIVTELRQGRAAAPLPEFLESLRRLGSTGSPVDPS
jgi:putative GTP pyrophosphokinase